MPVLHVDKNSFQKEVFGSKGVVLVDFFASWCGPCKAMEPVLDELAGEVTNVNIAKINVEENPELASQFSVFSIPTFVIFKNGIAVSQFLARTKQEIKAELQKAG